MDELQKKIGYIFKDIRYLDTAITHSSFANESRAMKCECNERLEFLGDSILGFVVADYLYRSFPQMPEGRMTRLRAGLVCEQSLHEVAEKLELGRYIKLGRGEENTGGRGRTSILADAVEAVIAAMYLDGGVETARKFVDVWILSGIKTDGSHDVSDYKTALQELVQRRSGQVLAYGMLSESGPDHMKVFTAQVTLNDAPIGAGTGRTKKEAEQEAARQALEEMQK